MATLPNPDDGILRCLSALANDPRFRDYVSWLRASTLYLQDTLDSLDGIDLTRTQGAVRIMKDQLSLIEQADEALRKVVSRKDAAPASWG